jgi:hypothetical protein
MKKKYIMYAVLPVMAFAVVGISTASAHGMFGFGLNKATPEQIAQSQTDMFTQQANLLGISVDEVKSAWASGKSLNDLAKEKGITQDQLRQKMQDLRQQQMKSYLQTLVDKGVITQAQADSRLSFVQTNQSGKLGKGMRHGFGMGMGF